MTKLILAAVIGSACLTLASCADSEDADQNMAVSGEGASTEVTEGRSAPTTTTTTFPTGARIVEEDGVTFRIDPDGTRVRLGPTDSRIVVEDNVRFRVDPDGTRVRIDDRGATIVVDDDDVSVKVGRNPSLEVDTR